ncbi:hypothetical protein [Falsiroseomonas selenitidurans]|uniref:Uncharacterized protein n=1 Tax=Falsiroseomonas selenitidurans TaxID=2716335 RepID=A0ABX1E5H9_9PROT|nr:hypothetical protein [Falsiroseomonas selenitidurans]NKC30190.1 hypothetical protein [Falsiroseomonas selenitidurans]
MTALATRPTRRPEPALLPATPPAPRPPSPALAQAMALALRATESRPDNPDRLSQDLAQAVAAEARHRLEATEAALGQRAEPAAIQAWVMRVIALIGHPRDPDEIAGKLAALTDRLGELPRRCLTKRSAGLVADAAGNFFPSARDLVRLLLPEASDLEHERRRLRAILARAEPPPRPPVLTAEERAAMSAKARAYAAEVATLEAARKAAECRGEPADAAARRRAMQPETSEEEIRAMAATAGAGAALARMRLVVAERLRSKVGSAA